MFLLALAAAQLSAPTGRNLLTLFGADDVPLRMLGNGEVDKTVGIRLTVRPDGRLQSCEVESSSGMAELDSYTCKLASRRAKFTPASAQAGTLAYAVYRAPVRWTVSDSYVRSSAEQIADFTLIVNTLPKGSKSAVVALKFDIDEHGHPSNCLDETLPGKVDKDDPDLVRVACEQLLRTFVAIPAKDETGKAVASVQDALVAFAIH